MPLLIYSFILPRLTSIYSLHFIGATKPWDFEEGKVELEKNPHAYPEFYAEMVGKWWGVWRQANERLESQG
jgi:hypothetical protein